MLSDPNRDIGPWQYSFKALCKWIMVLAVVFALLRSSKSLYVDRPQRIGRSQADADWANHDAVIYGPDFASFRTLGPYEITRWYDDQTGLKYRAWRNQWIDKAYSKRIDELIRDYGVPSWSAKAGIPGDSELIAMLQSTMTPVAEFPYAVSPIIVLQSHARDGKRSLTVEVRNARNGNVSIDIPDTCDGVYVARDSNRPSTVFVRRGRTWGCAINENGYVLAEVFTSSIRVNPQEQPAAGVTPRTAGTGGAATSPADKKSP